MMRKARWSLAAASLALTLTFIGAPGARGEPSGIEKPVAVARPMHTGGATGHVYLLRGLMNIFSLGMDDLAEKLNKRGIAATATGYTGWQSLADQIAGQYKAGRHGPIVLIGHSFGADSVMEMGNYLGRKGVPVALVVPLDASGPIAATAGVARVMNLTQRDNAKMSKGPGFTGELVNIDVGKDGTIGHLNIDKAPRLHAMVIRKIESVIGKGGGAAPVPAQDPAPRSAGVKLPPAKPAEAVSTSNVAASTSVPPAPAIMTPPPAPAPAATTDAIATPAAPRLPQLPD